MGLVNFGECVFDAGLIVFDKDGTLIDFGLLWGAKTVEWVEAMVATAEEKGVVPQSGLAALEDALYAALGYEPERRQFASQGPMLTASIATLYTVVATVFYQHGVGWLDSELLVRHSLKPSKTKGFTPAQIRGLADMPALFESLRAAGVAIAVVTSDNEGPARRTLEFLGVAEQVCAVIGADSGMGEKPDPQGVWAACRAAGVELEHCAVVGDSTTDMLMAARAGAGLRVAVTSGWMSAETLAPTADVVLGSIAEIGVGQVRPRLS